MESPESIDVDRIAAGMARRRDARIASDGTITFPAVPGMLDDFTGKCVAVFAGLGRKFNDPETAHLRSVLERQIAEAFSRSHRSTITVTYRSPVSDSLSYEVAVGAPTIAELDAASDGLPLRLESDECVHDYEKQHLPEGGWPPTGWYENWVSGRDLFDVDRDHRPIDMRWLVYRKI